MDDELFCYGWFFSLVKCIQIVLVLQEASIREFNIFDVDKVFFFTSWTILLNRGGIFSGQSVGFLVPYLFELF